METHISTGAWFRLSTVVSLGFRSGPTFALIRAILRLFWPENAVGSAPFQKKGKDKDSRICMYLYIYVYWNQL